MVYVSTICRALCGALMLLAVLTSPARPDHLVELDTMALEALAGLPVLGGDPLEPSTLDDRVLVLAFFASWCPPCHPEFEHLKRIDRVYRARGVTVVAVNIFENMGGNDAARLDAFLVAKAAAFHVLGDGEQVAHVFGRVERIPTLFVFGLDGRPVLHFVHARGATKTHATFEEIETAVRSAL